jgi:hypothetical protein
MESREEAFFAEMIATAVIVPIHMARLNRERDSARRQRNSGRAGEPFAFVLITPPGKDFL